MMKNIKVNEKVQITAMGFRKNMAVYPRRMEYRGATYQFVDAGLRCLVRHGERIAEVLTLSDGKADYHIRNDSNSGWTLISIAPRAA